MKKRLVMGIAALSLAATACGTGNGSNEDEIKIGSMFEKTGEVSAYGTAEANAVNLAFKEINEDGGILDKKIDLIEYDTKSDNTEAASIATKLATQDEVPVIVGPATTGAVKASTPAVTRAGVTLVTPSGTDDSLTLDESGKVQPNIFRTSFQDSFQGIALAEFAANELGAEKAVIIGDSSSDYALGLTDAFEGTFEGEIIAEENFTADDTDFSAILTRIKDLDFDFIFLPGYYNQAGLIIKQAREMGITQPILGADGFGNQALLELAGVDNVDDVYYSAHYSPNSEDAQVQEFIAAYKAEYDVEPDMFAALAYDTAYLVAQAIEEAGEATPEAITAALEEITEFDGVTGTFSFDENHNPVKSTLVIELQDGVEAGNTEVTP
ncbi:amino acid/amide ABC transporter substrate-binding protein, HAAT family [Carnobacterium alterfunditum]|uniref:Amino acid/amide ABC transporter substrate-binding protein, HAAT family n=1 Tax=Carnobacterium alterfunditum TaxID=28230 RepID=A0A1N6HQP2_9LACT|nr:ABC transporter substrate-binding protein [Carnobacterium alterfunditum]SIO22009.1 amino acid/amide ABC transporter substrate-binding protein, HAAT family [Carnobacterium alterfunditum]